MLVIAFVGTKPGQGAAQQTDPARLPQVMRVLAALRPDLRLTYRTVATAPLIPDTRAAVVAGGQTSRYGEWMPETWAVVLLDPHLPSRIRVLDTLRTDDVRTTFEYAARGEVLVRREDVDYGENMFGDEYRQYFFDPATWAERGRRIYRSVSALSPVAVQDSVFAAVQFEPMRRTDTVYPSMLLAVPIAGGAPAVHKPPLDSIYRLEAFGNSLAVMTDSRTWMRMPVTGQWVGTPALDSLVRERRLADSLHLLHPRLPAFRVLASDSSDTIEEIRLTGTRRTPLPAPSWELFARTRPEPVAVNTLKRGDWQLHSRVGPTAIVGERLWFGLTFYDGEGMSGVGGLGVLDPASGQLKVRFPPAMAEWSVASLAAEDSVLWIGLASYGEGNTTPGGLARYEIATGRLVRFDVPGVITGILPMLRAVYLSGERGLHVLHRETGKGDVLERITVRIDRAASPHVLRTRSPVRPFPLH